MKAARLLLGLALAGLCLWLIFRHLDPAEVRAAFIGATPGWTALAALCLAAGYSCRIQRWRLMLRHGNPALGWRRCAGPFLGSFAANNVLPFRLGDVLRTLAFNRRLGVNAATALTSVIVERLLDLLMLLLLLGLALLWFGREAWGLAAALGQGGGWALMALAAGLTLLLFWPGLFKPAALRCCAFIPRVGEAALQQAQKIFAALEHTAKGGVMRPLLLWSLLAWAGEGCVFWCVGHALPSLALPAGAWLALPMGSLATLVPSAPGYIGTFDYFAMQAMVALGENPATAAAFALIVHVVLWLPVTLIGGAYLLLHRIDWQAPA